MKSIIYNDNGVEIRIIEINKNKSFSCTKCSSYCAENCMAKKRCSISPTRKELIATEIVLVVANMMDKPISISPGFWEVVDSEGFSYGCSSFCEDHIPPRMVNPSVWSVTPGTQVKFALAFPEIEEKTNVISIIFTPNSKTIIRIDARKPTKKVEALLAAREKYTRTVTSKNITNK